MKIIYEQKIVRYGSEEEEEKHKEIIGSKGWSIKERYLSDEIWSGFPTIIWERHVEGY